MVSGSFKKTRTVAEFSKRQCLCLRNTTVASKSQNKCVLFNDSSARLRKRCSNVEIEARGFLRRGTRCRDASKSSWLQVVLVQRVRCTTWNLEWFPNGSAHDASPEEQNRRITDAANVLKSLHPDILLLQEVRDYDACSRLGDAIEPGAYHVEICSAFKEPFQSGLGRQQVAILSRFQRTSGLVGTVEICGRN